MFEWNADEKRLEALHHPFTAPHPDDIDDLKTARAVAYDLVLNGYEIGGGSLRIYQPDVQQQVFDTIGLAPEEAHNKFGFLLEAFEYGTPPHGGIAYGLDRIVMLMTGEESIRDAIPFPKTQQARCLLTLAPSGWLSHVIDFLFLGNRDSAARILTPDVVIDPAGKTA
jgi:aspartyl-tRNA synthetase